MLLSELKRLYHIIKVFLSYGLDELIPKHRITFASKIGVPSTILDQKISMPINH